jgi:LSD1 subclass zinc finger protein
MSLFKRRPAHEGAAAATVAESCGRKLDIAGGETPCPNCGAPLSFPVGASGVECPHCHTGTHRV